MEKSKVYFTDFRTPHSGMSIPQKLQKLIKKAGIGDINFEKQFAAIKIHFGEPGNISYLRPNFAKAVVDVIKELGGKPFLTDCNTLLLVVVKKRWNISTALMKMASLRSALVAT